MTIHLFVLLITLGSQQPTQQQLQQQQQTQLEQIRLELLQQRQQLNRLGNLIERPDTKQIPAKSVCSAEIRRVGGSELRKVPPNSAAVVPLNLFSVVTMPAEDCLNAEIRVTANYLDADDALICSGVVEYVATQTALTQSINLEVRPWNLREFIRWRNEPPQINSGAKRLVCVDADGLTEASTKQLERVTSVRLLTTVLPRGGGMSTTEVQLSLQH